MTCSSVCYQVACFVLVWMLVDFGKTVLFRTNLMILHLSATRASKQQHQFGQASRNGKELEVIPKLETTSGGLSGPAPCRRSQPRGPDPISYCRSHHMEFEALSEFLPDLPDTDARTLALRTYYLELSENVSSHDVHTKGN